MVNQSSSIGSNCFSSRPQRPFSASFAVRASRPAPDSSRCYHQCVMAANFLLQEFPWRDRYRVPDLDNVLTPALALYPDAIASNIQSTLNLLGGNADRWRAHIKTAKLNYTLRVMIDRGVRNFKCATTLELLQACESGATDVLVAYPHMAANARRVREIASQHPNTRISVLAENE